MKMRVIILLVFIVCPLAAHSQIRNEKLIIKPREVFKIDPQSDIIVADTLIMMDSSTIVLNALRPENYIRAKVIIAGKATSIRGTGATGATGRAGRPGADGLGPCNNAAGGTDGAAGLAGVNGTHLFLYFDHLVINGQLAIILTGGHGGNGGAGGAGGNGSPGTVHCNGGHGGNGGNGGRGGQGGHGGNVLIQSPQAMVVRGWVGNKLVIKNYAGAPGFGGRSGNHGSAGLGPSRRNGRDGSAGMEGSVGQRGNHGVVTFQTNQQ